MESANIVLWAVDAFRQRESQAFHEPRKTGNTMEVLRSRQTHKDTPEPVLIRVLGSESHLLSSSVLMQDTPTVRQSEVRSSKKGSELSTLVSDILAKVGHPKKKTRTHQLFELILSRGGALHPSRHHLPRNG